MASRGPRLSAPAAFVVCQATGDPAARTAVSPGPARSSQPSRRPALRHVLRPTADEIDQDVLTEMLRGRMERPTAVEPGHVADELDQRARPLQQGRATRDALLFVQRCTSRRVSWIVRRRRAVEPDLAVLQVGGRLAVRSSAGATDMTFQLWDASTPVSTSGNTLWGNPLPTNDECHARRAGEAAAGAGDRQGIGAKRGRRAGRHREGRRARRGVGTERAGRPARQADDAHADRTGEATARRTSR